MLIYNTASYFVLTHVYHLTLSPSSQSTLKELSSSLASKWSVMFTSILVLSNLMFGVERLPELSPLFTKVAMV